MIEGTLTVGEMREKLAKFPAEWRMYAGEGVAITDVVIQTDDKPLIDLVTEEQT